MDTCSTCNQQFQPTVWMVRKSQHTCSPCLNAYQKAYRISRKQVGNPVASGSRMSREYRRQKDARYREQPGVRARLARRARRARVRSRNPAEQAKMASRRLLRSAVEVGKVIRQPCEVCGISPADAHHDDYFKPLDVRWLCPVHHYQQHQAAAKGEAQ